MKVNFNTEIKDLDNKPVKSRTGPQDIVEAMLAAGMKKNAIETHMTAILRDLDEDEAKTETLTARDVAKAALGSQDKDADGATRIDRIELALRINAAEEEIEITKKEAESILACVKNVYPGPVIYYRMSKLLEGALTAKPDAEKKAA